MLSLHFLPFIHSQEKTRRETVITYSPRLGVAWDHVTDRVTRARQNWRGPPAIRAENRGNTVQHSGRNVTAAWEEGKESHENVSILTLELVVRQSPVTEETPVTASGWFTRAP